MIKWIHESRVHGVMRYQILNILIRFLFLIFLAVGVGCDPVGQTIHFPVKLQRGGFRGWRRPKVVMLQ